ncbi:MAG: PilZ domain-containing protein [Candidatus Omnitrophota bacterium]
MEPINNQLERREFERLEFVTPLTYKVCKEETLSRLLQGYISNISQAGLLCNMKDKVEINNILWLCFDRGILHICEELERRGLIYQRGVIGKVVRIENREDGSYNVGVKFITREEDPMNRLKYLK